jgi:hypothetical protein
MRWAARCDPTSRKRAKASRVPVARRNYAVIVKIPYWEGHAPCAEKNSRQQTHFSTWGGGAFSGGGAHSRPVDGPVAGLINIYRPKLALDHDDDTGAGTLLAADNGRTPNAGCQRGQRGAGGARPGRPGGPRWPGGPDRGRALGRVPHYRRPPRAALLTRSGRFPMPVPVGRLSLKTLRTGPAGGRREAGRRGLGALNGHGM